MTRPYDLPINYNQANAKVRKLVREEYAKRQKGLCYHCNKPLKESPAQNIIAARIDWHLFPKNFLDHPVHLHHSRRTGMTLGSVHARCNAYLWQYKGE